METDNHQRDKKMWNYYSVENPRVFIQNRTRLHFLAKKVLKLMSHGSLLDIGIGDGFLFEDVHKKTNKVEFFGIDITENMSAMEQALQSKGIRVTLQNASIDHLPFPDNFFDMVTASELIEHLDDETLENGLREVSRVLKSGGHFLATTPCEEDLELSMCHCPQCGHTFHRIGHKQSFSKERLQQYFSRFFNSTDISLVTFYSRPRPSHGLLKKIVYHIKLVGFGILKYIIGSYFSFFIQSRK